MTDTNSSDTDPMAAARRLLGTEPSSVETEAAGSTDPIESSSADSDALPR